MKRFIITWLFGAFVTSCAPSFKGIKVRAQAPPIEEAFRKLSLAITVDGYEIETIDPKHFTLETKWRELKENESAPTQELSQLRIDGKIKLELRRRGSLYDVLVTPIIIHPEHPSITSETDVNHPLLSKWKRIINAIVQRESREEE